MTTQLFPRPVDKDRYVPTKKKLLDADWRALFAIRCRSKQGHPITSSEQRLCTRAMREDPDRYNNMSADVFDATVPFGSSMKAKR
jgi:hypothetical protein